MARKPMVTRTMKSTKVTAIMANTETETLSKRDFILPRTYDTDKELMKALAPIANTDTEVAIKVVATEVQEQLYGMDEAKFISLAEPLPARDAKSED